MKNNACNPYDVDLDQLTMDELDLLANENQRKMTELSGNGPSQEFYVASVLFVRAGQEYNRRRMVDEYMGQYNVISDGHGTERAEALLGD